MRGTITPSGLISTANTGSTVFTVKPNAGYMIGSVTLDGAQLPPSGVVTGGATYTVTHKATTQKIVASFLPAVATKLEAKLNGPLSIAAGTLPNSPGHLAGWIADPQEVKPGNRMPTLDLSGEELTRIRRYVETLR